MGKSIVIVSGLPRSGTSMLMKMLEAGGIEIVTDNLRKADPDNPKGYYEYEKVKYLQKDSNWVHTMQGKVIKVISFLLYSLPMNLSYKIIFVRRDMQEILASQKKMLNRLGENANTVSDELIAQKFATHLQKVTTWIAGRKNIECVYLNYTDILGNPIQGAEELQRFLQEPLNIEKMGAAVDPALYRNRKN